MMPRSYRMRRSAALASTAVWTIVVGLSTWNHLERPLNVNAALHAANTGQE